MSRARLFFVDQDDRDKTTFSFDEMLPALPLPELRDTMENYYTSLVPFGTPEELAQSWKIIEEFQNGIGVKLQAILKERAEKMKNWLGTWWEDYGYHMLRLPLLPYQLMSIPSHMKLVDVPTTPEYMLKCLARQIYFALEFWNITRNGTMKPLSSNGGKIKYSSNLFKFFFSTSRVPGAEQDHIESYFLTKEEGSTPTHVLIGAKGRQFIFNGVHDDDTILTAPEILVVLQRLRSILDYEPEGDGVAALTHDDRTTWAKNRNHLMEICKANKETLRLVESSCVTFCWDEHSPQGTGEASQLSLFGDYYSRWGDRSNCIVTFKNGHYVLTGEHSCYDGSHIASFATFMQLSFYENPDPDWSVAEYTKLVELKELKFQLDDTLRSEIKRVLRGIDERGMDVNVSFTVFDDFGKEFMKNVKLHPDSFVQVVMQWAYYQMHQKIAPTYETALMRHYYNGRTETLRSCSKGVYQFLKASSSSSTTDKQLVRAFRSAVSDHRRMMDEARMGSGIDRHLFGLWCAAYENKIEIPALYNDPMYAKSGGGGNFLLSTSTLGFTPNVGFVAPMTFDGYGVFYNITSDAIYILSNAYRDSIQTSPRKFNIIFKQLFRRIRDLLDTDAESKL